MSTTAKIDFDPDLFADGGPDAEHDLPTSNQPTRRTNRAPFIVIVAGSLLFVLASMAAFKIFDFSAKTRGESLGVSNILSPPFVQLSAAPEYPAMPMQSQAAMPMQSQDNGVPSRQYVHDFSARASDVFCGGNEAMCSTITTDKPAEALAKIAAIVPKEQGKHYRLQVSVTAIDEE